MIELCLCILLLTASAAMIKFCWFPRDEKHKGDQRDKQPRIVYVEKHKDDQRDKQPRIVYMLKSRSCFHIKEGCKRIRDKKPDIYTMCDDCFSTV